MAENKKTASVDLTGDAGKNFMKVLFHMRKSLPGIDPNNRDVLRHALHIAASTLGSDPGDEEDKSNG